MQDSNQPQEESDSTSDLFSSPQNVLRPESNPYSSENIVFTEKKYSSHNSYFLEECNLNQTDGYSTPKHHSEFISAYYTSPRSSTSFREKDPEPSALSGQKPLVASYEYSPSGTCIKSSLSGHSALLKSFSTPDRKSDYKGPIRNGSNKWTTFKGNPRFTSTKPFCSVNKNRLQKNIYTSSSSNFVCSKCGLGYPCTLFLCKRTKYSPIYGTIKQESQNVNVNSSIYENSNNGNLSSNSNLNEKSSKASSLKSSFDFQSNKYVSPLCGKTVESIDINYLRYKDSCGNDISNKSQLEDVSVVLEDSAANTTVLPNKTKFSSSSTEKSVQDLISELFPEQEIKRAAVNDKELPKKDKGQYQNKCDKLKIASSCKPMKNDLEVSTFETNKRIKNFVLQQNAANKDSNDLLCLGDSEMKSTVTNSPLIGSGRKNHSQNKSSNKSTALSQETKNFLNELAASAASNDFSDVCNYILSPANSQTSDSSIALGETITKSNDSDYVLPSTVSPVLDSKPADENVINSENSGCILETSNSLVLDPKATNEIVLKSSENDYILTSTSSLSSNSKIVDKTFCKRSIVKDYIFTSTGLISSDSKIANEAIIQSTNHECISNSLALRLETADETGRKSNNSALLMPSNSLTFKTESFDFKTSDETVTDCSRGDYISAPINLLSLGSKASNEILLETEESECISSSLILNSETVDETHRESSHIVDVLTSLNSLTNVDLKTGDEGVTELIDSDYIVTPTDSLYLDSKIRDKSVINSSDNDCILIPTNSLALDSKIYEKTVIEYNNSDYNLVASDSFIVSSKTSNENAIEFENSDDTSNLLTLDSKTVDETPGKSKDIDNILAPISLPSLDFKTVEGTFVKSDDCDYILASTNSLTLNSKIAVETVGEPNDSEIKMSVSNESEEQCGTLDVNKDLTNALELIAQSSIYDKGLSSAEICNSLNPIFSPGGSVNSPVNEESNAESIQIDETAVSMESTYTPLVEDNESQIFLQTDPGVVDTADSDNYINISDFYLGDTPENVQNILIIQDEAGNVETLYIIQDPDNTGGGVLVTEGTNEEPILVDDSVAYNTDNILTDNSVDELQNLLISQGIINTVDDALDAEQSILSSGQTLDPAPLADNIPFVHNDLDDSHSHSEIKNLQFEVKDVKLPVDDHTEVETVPVTEEKVENLNTQNLESAQSMIVDVVKDIAEHSSDKIENILLTLSKNAEISVSAHTEKNNVDLATKDLIENVNVSVDRKSLDEIPDLEISKGNVNSQNSDASIVKNFQPEFVTPSTIHSQRKAKKSSSSIVSIVKNAIKESNLDFHNHYNTLCERSGDFGRSIENSSINPPIKISPMNGAVFYSEVSTDSNQVGNYTLSNTGENCMVSQFSHIATQKSKKTFSVNKPIRRSAKKSFPGPIANSPNPFSVLNSSLKDAQSYVAFNSTCLKRAMEDDEIDDYPNKKRAKKSVFNAIDISKNRTVALKTFKKPFTAARKSVLDSRDCVIVKNTALKSCMSKMHMKTALKSVFRKQPYEISLETYPSDSNLLSRNINAANVNMQQKFGLSSNNDHAAVFQPEICEIRILPNEYIKRASSLLLNGKNLVDSESPDENISDEEIKLSSCCISPIELCSLQEIMSFKSKCSCTSKEIPCICNESSNLQLTCEAEDSIGEIVVPCSNKVSQQYLLTPSSEIMHRAFCDIHLWRLRQHHCCPKCGRFCSQGQFSLCSLEGLENKENHLFHTGCFLIPAAGLPPSCPHCCKFSSFASVHLVCKSSIDSELKEVPSNSKNITSGLNGSCDIFMTIHQSSESIAVSDSKIYTPITDDIQEMINALARKKYLRLRPTGKCLFNPVRTGDFQKVMQLIGNGVDPNHQFKDNNTPLHVAAEYGWIGILHILLQAGAIIDAINNDLETPLILAVERNRLPIVRYLVHAGAQIDAQDCNGMSSFHIACKNGSKEIAEFLYKTGSVDINLQDEDGGWTALMWSGEHKHKELTQWLLDIGSDPNLQDKEKNTVLHWAAYSGDSEIAKLFLDWGCNISYVNKRGDSAIHVAARENNYECVKLLVAYGAQLDQKNKNNQTPLMCCDDDTLTFNFLCESISSGALKLKKMHLEKHIVYRDISRGAEVYPIQVINEVDNEEFIMEFRYVVKNCHRSGVDIISTVNSMQYCSCKDSCVTHDCACTMNSKCWYDVNGCLTNEFDDFWPSTIFECNKTCHCPKTCINRVVQKGMRCRLQLFRTWYQGWGVRTLQHLPKGAFVCEYIGELISGSELTQRDDDTYYFDLESQEGDYCLDGRYFGNVARFFNHSCEPNLIALKIFVDHQDMNFPRIAFFTARPIKPFEELCFDYGLDFWIVKSQYILCTCNTPNCKYSKDTIDDTLQKFFMDTKSGNEAQSVVTHQELNL